MNKDSDFKVCPCCGFVWENREDLLNDNDVSLVGYQVHFKKLTAGLFLFNHSCKTTFGLKVSSFKDLYDGPIFKERATGSDDCPGYCLRVGVLERCPASCECAFVREIIQVIKR